MGWKFTTKIIILQWFFERKRIFEYLEANFTGAPIYASNPDALAVAEEASSDEAITAVAKSRNEMEIDIEEEHKT